MGASLNLKKKQKFVLAGRCKFQGFPISIENKKGSTRSGVDPDGQAWSIPMKFDYGYITGTTSPDDGEGIDVYLGDNRKATAVYIVKQHKIEEVRKHFTGKDGAYCPECAEHAHDCACSRFFDEDKVFLGFDNKEAVRAAYLAQYDSPLFLGPVSTMTVEAFKDLLFGDDTLTDEGTKIPLQFITESVQDGDDDRGMTLDGLLEMLDEAEADLQYISRVPADAPVIDVPDIDIVHGDNLKDMRKAMLRYAKDLFGNEMVVNRHSKAQIRVARSGIGHTASGAMPPLLRTLPVTPQILEQGVYLGAEPDKKDENVKLVHYYGIRVRLDESIHDVVAVVKEDLESKERYYDHSFERVSG